MTKDIKIHADENINIAEKIDASNLSIRSKKDINIDTSQHSINARNMDISAKNLKMKGNGLISKKTDAEIKQLISDIPDMLRLYEENKKYGPTVTVIREKLTYDAEVYDGTKPIIVSNGTITFGITKISMNLSAQSCCL